MEFAKFKVQATLMMSSGETLVIERHGKPIGFFVPVTAKDRQEGRAALGRLGQVLESVSAETELDENEIARDLAGRRRC